MTMIDSLSNPQPCCLCGQPTPASFYGEPMCAGCQYEQSGDFDALLDRGERAEIQRYIDTLRARSAHRRRVILQLRALLQAIDQTAPVTPDDEAFAAALQAVRDMME